MAEFTFKSGIKTLDIKNDAGEVVRTYSINVGNEDQLKTWIKELKTLDSQEKDFSEDEKAIDEIVGIYENIIKAILGAGEWAFLWELNNKNVPVMNHFIMYLSEFLNEELANAYKRKSNAYKKNV